jgi:hypothetical protein
MQSYRLLAFLAAALLTCALLIVMITNDISVAQPVTGATLTDARADARPTSD